jgi:hypothetical protein
MDLENREELYGSLFNGKYAKKDKRLIFFLNGELHKLVRTNKSANICYAYNFNKKEIVKYTYRDYIKFKKRAFRIGEVAEIMRRHPDRIRVGLEDGLIKRPYLVEYKTRSGIFYFSEDDLYEIRNYFANLHRGRPRSDGIIVSKNVPTEQEIDAILGKRQMLYVRTQEGKYVPVWKAEEFG